MAKNSGSVTMLEDNFEEAIDQLKTVPLQISFFS
jgi:hypothetical protein